MSTVLMECILSLLSPPFSEQTLTSMWDATEREWQRTLLWMDTTGVALYFLRAVDRQRLHDWVPDTVLEKLRWRQAQNVERTRDLVDELAAIAADFEEAGIRFLVLKGFGNVPEACPEASLRLQIDIDLMIEDSALQDAETVLQQRGYGLTAVGGRTWEFRSRHPDLPQLANLYSATRQRSLDVHPVSPATFEALYSGRSRREVEGLCFNAPDGVDRFLAQSSHLAKHMRGEWTRVSWILEMCNAIDYWMQRPEFWPELHNRLRVDRSVSRDLGVAVLLCRAIFDKSWENSVLREAELMVPARVRLWIAEYGRYAVLRSFPGSKLYLLMEEAARPVKGRGKVLPTALPPRAVPAGRGWRYQVRAARSQCTFVLFRSRFHLRENFRYLLAMPRWRRLSAQLEEGR